MLSKTLWLQLSFTMTPVWVEVPAGAVQLSCRNLSIFGPRWRCSLGTGSIRVCVSVACRAHAVALAAPSCPFGSSRRCLDQYLMSRPLGNIPHLHNSGTPTRVPCPG